MRNLPSASAAILVLALVAGCERPPVAVDQLGFRGVGMEEVTNPRLSENVTDTIPMPLPPAAAAGPKAGQIYQNVQVLGDLSVGQFTRVMQAMVEWVAPEQGCAYCHVAGEALSADTLYTKVVSRRMLEMTLNVNSNWDVHVAGTGVTCYTCHRGQNVPEYGWFRAAEPKSPPMIGYSAGQNRPSADVALASLPYDPFSAYLESDDNVRVIAQTALPGGTGKSIQATERTYGLMMHMSQALGVNCTYCHNSRSFTSWDQSRPQRTPAWHGIRMVRQLNEDYLVPLTSAFPDKRLGPTGDVLKVNCATCHQGASKPLKGISMLEDYPELSAGR